MTLQVKAAVDLARGLPASKTKRLDAILEADMVRAPVAVHAYRLVVLTCHVLFVIFRAPCDEVHCWVTFGLQMIHGCAF